MNKDLNYRQFYNDILAMQASKEEKHKELVMSPELQKQIHMDQIIEKNIEEKCSKDQEELDQKVRVFKENLTDTALSNRSKYLSKENTELLKKKMEKRLQDEQRMKELDDYNEFITTEKDRKKAIQLQYKQVLELQALEQKKMKSISMSMSPLEKKINYPDLQAYKGYDPTLYAMIPGWSPQIGGMPAEQYGVIRTEGDEEGLRKSFSPKTFKNLKGFYWFFFVFFCFFCFFLIFFCFFFVFFCFFIVFFFWFFWFFWFFFVFFCFFCFFCFF